MSILIVTVLFVILLAFAKVLTSKKTATANYYDKDGTIKMFDYNTGTPPKIFGLNYRKSYKIKRCEKIYRFS